MTSLAPYDLPARANSNSQRNRVADFAAGVLPIPAGYWSIFALISADNSESGSVTGFAHWHRDGTAVLSWMRRNIVPAVAGSLADVYNEDPLRFPPPEAAHIDEALRQALTRLDNDARTTTDARTVPAPWTTRQAGQAPSTLLAFFDSESRKLRIANAGAGRAFFGRRVAGAGGHECRELTASSSGGEQYFVNPASDTHSNARAVAVDVDVEDLIDGAGASPSPSRGGLDAASVNVESVEVRDGDFLVLASHDTWACLDGNEAVQAISGWLREQEVSNTQERQPVRRAGSWWSQDRRFLDFPWRDDYGLGFGFDWVHTMVPDLIRDVDKMFVRTRGNLASRVLQLERRKHGRDGNSGNDQDFYPAVRPGCSSPAPGSE